MPETSGSRVSRRPIPGSTLSASSIAFALEPPRVAPPSADDRTVALLRRARAHGVTTFDVAAGPSSRRAERLLSRAFPTDDPELFAILHRSVSDLANEGSGRAPPGGNGALEGRLRESVAASGERLRPLKVGLLQWEPDPTSTPESDTAFQVLENLRGAGAFSGWVQYVPRNDTPSPAGDAAAAGRPRLYSGALSPLETRLVLPLAGLATRGPTGFFARDPFGSGRLDGSRFARSFADRRPDVGPIRLRELRREFDPVLRLGFLTADRRRTLAQASLGFVLRFPWVCAAIVPLPPPERLEEMVGAERAPPISDAEADQVLALPND